MKRRFLLFVFLVLVNCLKTNYENPTKILDSLDYLPDIKQMLIENGIIYLMGYSDRINVIDAHSPEDLKLVNQIECYSHTQTAIQSNKLYVPTYAGVIIFNIADPEHIISDTIGEIVYPIALEIYDSLLIAIQYNQNNWSQFLAAWNIKNIYSPICLDTISIMNVQGYTPLHLYNEYIYVLDGSDLNIYKFIQGKIELICNYHYHYSPFYFCYCYMFYSNYYGPLFVNDYTEIESPKVYEYPIGDAITGIYYNTPTLLLTTNTPKGGDIKILRGLPDSGFAPVGGIFVTPVQYYYWQTFLGLLDDSTFVLFGHNEDKNSLYAIRIEE